MSVVQRFLLALSERPRVWMVVLIGAGIVLSMGVAPMLDVWVSYDAARPLGLNIYSGASRVFVVAFIVFAIYGLIVSTMMLLVVDDTPLHQMIWSLWTIVPPFWFVIEYFFIYPYLAVNPVENFKYFQYGQDVASKLWAAGFVISGAVLYTRSR
jgi:hypothetical protein